MTTSDPSLAVEIANRAKGKGVHSVDAPVSGGDIGAREARLSIMIGGEKEIVEGFNPAGKRWERPLSIKADPEPVNTPS